MRRVCVLVATSLTVAACVWLSQSVPDWRDASAAPAEAANAGGPAYIGVSGCAAAACHNANGPVGTRGSEYTTWAAVDPHAKAYGVLFDDRSKKIQELRKTKTPAEEDVLCLKCHSTYRGVDPKADDTLADGVGCESCHGPAEKWKATHFRPDFRPTLAPGFHDLRTVLVARAESCVGCHVGNKDKEVNHDLIAAGHPRLRFEFAAYLANYPKHWKEGDDRRRFGDDFQAEAWQIGQAVSAKAALDLLRERYTNKDKPWPEFAEHDCYACHHDLVDPSWRRDRAVPGQKFGLAPMSTWYTITPQLLEPDGLGKTLADLGKKVGTFPRRDDAQVLEGISTVRDTLGKRVTSSQLDSDDVKRLLTVLAKDPGNKILDHPDNAIQFYLSAAALQHALNDLGSPDPRLRQGILDLRNYLEKSFGPTTEQGRDVRYDSPKTLKKEDLEKRVREIQKHLGVKHP